MVKNSQPRKPRFVCGIDFGTTFTSVAFAHSDTPNEVKLVQTWPSATNGSADDVPSEVHYINHLSKPRQKQWGHEIPKDTKNSAQPLQWFKLLLQQQAGSEPTPGNASTFSLWHQVGRKSSPYARRVSVDNESLVQLFGRMMEPEISAATPLEKTAAKLKELQLKPVDVVADFLRSVRESAVTDICSTYGKDFVAQSKIEYVLSIPAIWKDHAKNTMIQAAQKAQFGNHRADFHLCSEPEAAAVYTLRVLQPNNFKVGESFVICDAGGGTCDLVSYEIQNLHPLKVNEVVTGSGDLCGSVFLDQGFDRYIRSTLGDSTIDNMRPRARNQMHKSFVQDVKVAFGKNPAEKLFEVNVPGLKDDDRLRIEDGFHSMAAKDLKAIFDPVVNRIVELVRKQVGELQKKGRGVAAIILVGGFGSSPYLKTRLEETLYSGMKIEVIQPPNARTAIARGALMRGIDGSMVYEKRARRFYGCAAAVDIASHASHIRNRTGWEEERFWDHAHDIMAIHGWMIWFLKKEAVIGDTFSTTFDFVRTVPVETPKDLLKSKLIFEDDLLACDSDEVPKFRWEEDADVYKVCTLRSDLSKIPVQKFEIIENCAGERYYCIRHQLKLSLVGDALNFELLFQGKRCGNVNAKFDS